MTLIPVRYRLLFVVAGVLLLFTGACSGNLGKAANESPTYPPPPASVEAEPYALAAETLPPPTITSAPQGAASPVQESGDSAQPLATAPAIPATPKMPSPTATVMTTVTPVPSPTPCALPGQIETAVYDSPFAGRINYRVYLPPCYSDSGRTYPVLYMLPGNIHTDGIWDELGLDEALEIGIKEKRFPPMLIVMVSGGSLANTTSGGPWSYESFMMEEFIPHVEETYCALPRGRGRAIGGMSRGGYWALEIAFRHPDEFASVGGHSAALVDFNGGPDYNPLDTGLNSDLDDLRIYLDVGKNDWLLPNAQKLHEEMSALDKAHTWVLNEGIHEEAYWAEHVTDYMEWYSTPWLNPEIIYPPCRFIAVGYSS